MDSVIMAVAVNW